MNVIKKLLKATQKQLTTLSGQEDIKSLELLSPLLKGYLPYTSSAIKPTALVAIANDISINNRRFIVELGGGVSTIILSNLLASLGDNRKLLTIEHDNEWCKFLKEKLDKDGNSQYVDVVHAPLSSCEYSVPNGNWYDTQIVLNAVGEKKIDLLMIDGPPAYLKSTSLSRYPALPVFFSSLSCNCSIFLDDSNRHGEKQIINIWKKDYNMNFNDIGGNMAMSLMGESLNCL